MAKKHLKTADGKAKCGATVDPSRLVENVEQVTCGGCLGRVGVPTIRRPRDDRTEPDWSRKCCVCGQSPIVPLTGMCGPCSFGEADTMLGNW